MQKIGIVQHDAAIRDMYQQKFELAGFATLSVATGPAGLYLWKFFKPEIMIVDFHLPYFHGHELIDKIAQLADKKWQPKYVITTNNDPRQLCKKHPKITEHKHVVKAHHTPSEILAIVNEMLGIKI